MCERFALVTNLYPAGNTFCVENIMQDSKFFEFLPLLAVSAASSSVS